MRKNIHAETHPAKALRRLAASAAVLLAVCLVLMTPVSAVGSSDQSWYFPSDPTKGTETNPYEITTAEALFGLAELVNYGELGPNPQPLNFMGVYIKLGDDIDLMDVLWEPIGLSPNTAFSGYFEGNGKTISGLNVSIQPSPLSPVSGSTYAGLFGYIDSGGSVTNLTVIGDVDVTGDGDAVFAGGIAGQNDGVIAESSFQGLVNAANDDNSAAPSPPLTSVGGIAGTNGGTIRNCYTTDAVTANGGNAVAGGMAGMNSAPQLPAEIQNCYATGTVEADGIQAYAGGIAGVNGGGTIEKCYALNDEVTVSGQYGASAARVVGLNDIGQSPSDLPAGNYGWKHMFQELPVNLPPGYDACLPSWNAPSICAVQILSASWDSTNIWTMTGRGNYKLPVLTNSNTNPSETPEHLLVEVTFNANGGTPTPTSQKVLDGALVTEPTGVVKTGYTLEGWYTEENFQNK